MRTKKEKCCALPGDSTCKVEAVIAVDERGQMVLPKETREKAGISAGDKLVLISFESDGKTCCLALLKVEELTGMLKGILGPIMKETIGERTVK